MGISYSFKTEFVALATSGNGALGTIADTEKGELGPLLKLTHDDVVRSPLHDNPSGHEAAGLVTALAQPLLNASPVGLELSCLGSDILRMSTITREHPQLVKMVEGVLTEHTHELVSLTRAQPTRTANKADSILRPPHGPPPRGINRTARNVQQLHRCETRVDCALDSIPIYVVLYCPPARGAAGRRSCR